MKQGALFRCFLAAATFSASLAGCSTVERAREAQRDLAPKGAEGAESLPADELDLKGQPLSRLVDFALENRPSVAAAALSVHDARLALREIASDAPLVSDTPWSSPQLSLSGGYSESSPGAGMGGAGSWRTSGSPSAALSLSLLVWDFGRYNARAQAQSERILSAELALAEAGYTVFEEVSRASFTFCEQAALLEVAHTNAFEYAQRVYQTERRLEAGEAKNLDLLRAKLDLAQAEEGLVSASNGLVTAGAQLMQALGIDASRGGFQEIVGCPPDALTGAYRAFPESKMSAREAFELGRTNAPAMRIARARLRAASADVDYAVANLMPTVSVSANLSWTDPLWYWNWGVNAVQSVFQGFRKTTAVDRAVVAMEQAATEVDRAEQALSLSIELAISDRDNAREARRTAEDSLRQARENLDTVASQYALGEASRIDYTEAVAAYSRALGSRISAFCRGQRAEAALFALVGAYPTYDEKKLDGGLK